MSSRLDVACAPPAQRAAGTLTWVALVPDSVLSTSARGRERRPERRDPTGRTDRLASNPGPSRDELFEALSNRRRREALRCVRGRGEGIDLGELAERIAARENDVPIEAVTSAERKRVYTALQQFHLPKLDEMGLVAYAPRAGTVEPTDATDSVGTYLGADPDRGAGWNRYVVATSVLGLALAGASALGAVPLSSVPPGGWAILAVVAVAIVAVGRAVAERRAGVRDPDPASDSRFA